MKRNTRIKKLAGFLKDDVQQLEPDVQLDVAGAVLLRTIVIFIWKNDAGVKKLFENNMAFHFA